MRVSDVDSFFVLFVLGWFFVSVVGFCSGCVLFRPDSSFCVLSRPSAYFCVFSRIFAYFFGGGVNMFCPSIARDCEFLFNDAQVDC